jgi:phosphoribosylformimino-5-aminoimidazole carboxamide ribotide isomerase
VTSDFELLPAIDLRGGRVVRLRQGDFAHETAYSDDPVAVATGFAGSGARWLHVVDLDGARSGVPGHAAVIAAIVAEVGGSVAVEVAGGIRSGAAARSILDAGAARVVIGTAGLRDPGFAGRLVADHGPTRVAAAIDVRDGRASGDGWAATAPTIDAMQAIATLADQGITTFEVTAIERDGLLQGPDLDLLRLAVELGRGRIIASAGIGTVQELRAVRVLGCAGAIVGRALYEGRLELRDAITALDGI